MIGKFWNLLLQNWNSITQYKTKRSLTNNDISVSTIIDDIGLDRVESIVIPTVTQRLEELEWLLIYYCLESAI